VQPSHSQPGSGRAPVPVAVAQKPKEWISLWLHPLILAALLSGTVVFICAITVLCILSIKKNGITTIRGDATQNVVSFQISLPLAWTTIPVLVFEIYVHAITASVKAAGARQPYIELRSTDGREGGSAIEKTLLLDYQSSWAPIAPFKALKLNHYGLSGSFLLILVVSLLLTSLSAHLMTTRLVITHAPVPVQQTQGFNDSVFNGTSDLTSTFDIVSATRIYGGEPRAWITTDASYVPFSLESVPETGVGPSNVSAETYAYSAILNCNVLGPSEFELLPTSEGNWEVSTSDRGCGIVNQPFAQSVNGFTTTYIRTYVNVSCSLEAQYTRIIVVGALNRNESLTTLTNKTAVSCIPSYYNTTGYLNVSVDSFTFYNPSIVSFAEANATLMDPRPVFAQNFEQQIVEPSIVDETDEFQGSDFGRLILDYAQLISPKNALEGVTLLNATETIFTSTMAVMANQFLLQPMQATHTRGTIFTSKTRLIVVIPIAGIILGMLSASFLMLLWVCYSRTQKSILYEEPKALLGAASILSRSDIIADLQELNANTLGGRIADDFVEKYQQSGWSFVDWDHPKTAKLMMVRATETLRPGVEDIDKDM